jgi:hypothetical protein
MDDNYASICGYTQAELESNFVEHIADVATALDMTTGGLLDIIRTWYDGYTWDGKTSVYNPFSTLLFFDKRMVAGYWYSTGSSRFLIDSLKKRNLTKTVLEPVDVGPSIFDSYDPENLGDTSLLFQTGYLTIKEKYLTNGKPRYLLAVPNLEVRESLMEHLLIAYTQFPMEQLKTLAEDILQNMEDCNSEGLQNNLRQLFADVPYRLQPKKKAAPDTNEALYHTIFQILMTMLGFEIQSEKETNFGRIDAVLRHSELAVVIEIKYHATTKPETLLKQAIQQIYDNHYYEPFLNKKVILLGLAFSGKEVSCRIEPLKPELNH